MLSTFVALDVSKSGMFGIAILLLCPMKYLKSVTEDVLRMEKMFCTDHAELNKYDTVVTPVMSISSTSNWCFVIGNTLPLLDW